MSYQNPDTISVEEKGQLDVAPKFAIMKIVIKGESYVLGDEAFKKSKEIVSFVSDLKSIDYSSENITLESVSIKTTTGKILKSSFASFTLKLDQINLELIPKILNIISNQKNIEIKNLEYDFGDLSKIKTDLYKNVCGEAKRQASEICSTFSVPLLGVYSMNAKWKHPHFRDDFYHDLYGARVGGPPSRGRDFSEEILEGLNFINNYTSKLILNLKVSFRVGAINA